MSDAMKGALRRVVDRQDLSAEEMQAVMGLVMDGEASDAQIAGLLTALRMKIESVDEVTGAVSAMRARALRLRPKAKRIMDTCGTGGDGAGTFNVSTTVAFVVAAAGVTVAKHGNRAISSKVGSADVLEALGVDIQLGPEAVTRCIDEVGIGFMYAPSHHSALRHAGPARRQLGFRTLLNLLGPMTNPAGATHQLIGVFDSTRVLTVAQVLGRLGSKRAIVVHGSDGLDELTLSGPTHAAIYDQGVVRQAVFTPEMAGVERAPVSALAGGETAEANASIVRDVLSGTPGPRLDVVRLNAGAALWAAEEAEDLEGGVARATQLLTSGAALDKLEALARLTKELAS